MPRLGNRLAVQCVQDSLSTYWIPPQLISTPDVDTLEMDTLDGWATIRSSLELNTDQKKSGTASIKMTATTTGATAIMSKTTLNWDCSSDSGRSLRLWVYAHTAVSTFNSITVILGSDTSFINNYHTTYYPSVNGSNITINNWTLLWGGKWSLGGGNPDWSSIKAIRIRIDSADGQLPVCSFDLISHGYVRQKAIMLFMDDNGRSTYQYAYPILKANKMVATKYAISSSIGGGNITEGELQELYANKWDIGNHTDTHPDLTTLTQQQVEDEVETCRIVLDGLGLTRGSKHVAYPGGAQNATVLAAMSHWGAKTGRTLALFKNVYEDYRYPYLIECGSTSEVTLETILAGVESALAINAVPALLFHNFVESDAGVADILVSVFTSIVDYIKSENLQTLTIDEYSRLATKGITVHHK